MRTGQDQFAIRFHLHPAVKATRLTDGHGVMLMTPNKEIWTFTAHEDRVELEDSVYLAGSEGPRRTTQIVIHGHARTASRVQWSLQHAIRGHDGRAASRRAAAAAVSDHGPATGASNPDVISGVPAALLQTHAPRGSMKERP